jgi:hypothetical protein
MDRTCALLSCFDEGTKRDQRGVGGGATKLISSRATQVDFSFSPKTLFVAMQIIGFWNTASTSTTDGTELDAGVKEKRGGALWGHACTAQSAQRYIVSQTFTSRKSLTHAWGLSSTDLEDICRACGRLERIEAAQKLNQLVCIACSRVRSRRQTGVHRVSSRLLSSPLKNRYCGADATDLPPPASGRMLFDA